MTDTILTSTRLTIPLQTLRHPLFAEKELSLNILRTDQTDPIISGNKWFKLKYNLREAQQQGQHTLLSFGGPYSNHLHALAGAGKALQFNTIGIIRGEQHQPLNPTLSDITAQGMKLYYIDRRTYRNKHRPEVIEQLRQLIIDDDPFHKGVQAKQFYLVPEGGTNQLAVTGAAEIAEFIPAQSNYVCLPCGTGGTMAGVIAGLSTVPPAHDSNLQVLGFPAMKGGQFLNDVIQQLLNEQNLSGEPVSWELMNDWHFGGFGKINKILAEFIVDFEKKYPLQLDPVYTAKMMYGIVSMAKMDFFPRGSKIIAIHTGGLQGKRGMQDRIQTLLAQGT